MDQAHFAKETVSSILKKAPAGEGPDKPQPGAQSKTPPRTPTKEGPRTPERVHYHDMGDYLSPRSQRRKYEQQVCYETRNAGCCLCIGRCVNIIPSSDMIGLYQRKQFSKNLFSTCSLGMQVDQSIFFLIKMMKHMLEELLKYC